MLEIQILVIKKTKTQLLEAQHNNVELIFKPFNAGWPVQNLQLLPAGISTERLKCCWKNSSNTNASVRTYRTNSTDSLHSANGEFSFPDSCSLANAAAPKSGLLAQLRSANFPQILFQLHETVCITAPNSKLAYQTASSSLPLTSIPTRAVRIQSFTNILPAPIFFLTRITPNSDDTCKFDGYRCVRGFGASIAMLIYVVSVLPFFCVFDAQQS